jgi:hypothetical protein
MSVLGAWLGKFTGAMGGVPAAGAIVAGGLVIGIVVGGVSGGGGLGASPAPSIVVSEIYPCPNMGPPLKSIQSGQHVYVTGKLADGTWLRIHYGSAGLTEAWIPATAYSVLGSLDDVPVATCTQAAIAAFAPSPAESITELGSFEPTAVPTASPTAAPTPAPTATPTSTPNSTPRATPRGSPRPTPRVTPAPTPPPTPPPPPPDTTPPSVSAPDANPSTIANCPDAQSATITVSASDNPGGSGLKSVTLKVFDAAGNQLFTKPMSKPAGAAAWVTTVSTNDPFPFGQSTYPLRATAVDKAGNAATSGAGRITVIKSDFC